MYTLNAQFIAMLRATLEELPFKAVAPALAALNQEVQRQDKEQAEKYIAEQIAKAAKPAEPALPQIKAD